VQDKPGENWATNIFRAPERNSAGVCHGWKGGRHRHRHGTWNGLRNNIARDVRTAWQQSQQAFERLSVTQQLRDQANLGLNLAQARYNLGLGSIVELGQAALQKTEADIANTDAQYQYRLTRLVLDYTIGAPK